MPTSLKYFNCHAHCFTIDHVPERFFDELLGGKALLRISNLKTSPVTRALVKMITGSFTRWLIRLFSPATAHKLQRLHGLIKYAIEPTQEVLIKQLDDFYHSKYRLVLLTMDMAFMDAGDTQEDFTMQLEKLQLIKQKPEWHDQILPFVFADPRRPNVTSLCIKYLTDAAAPFQGIKLYPAIGYFPFDKGLRKLYQFAIENEVPVLTHCIVGDVHLRDENFYKTCLVHPVSAQTTVPTDDYKKPAKFQINFTHPLNYECLLNKTTASAFFGEETDFSSLKICIAHFGGAEEWDLYKKQEASSSSSYKAVYDYEPLDINQKWLGESNERYSWLKIIKQLIRKYPNVYTDISFTLHDESIYPVLKSMLKDETIKYRIMYGTDFYVVASETEEPELITLMKKHLSDEEIKLISYDNPLKFFSSRISPLRE